MHCFAGCPTADILSAMELSWSDLDSSTDFENSGNGFRRSRERCYQYEDEHGNPLYEVVRGPKKKFL